MKKFIIQKIKNKKNKERDVLLCEPKLELIERVDELSSKNDDFELERFPIQPIHEKYFKFFGIGNEIQQNQFEVHFVDTKKSDFYLIPHAKPPGDYEETELYRDLENMIIKWSNDGTKTAGTLTRKILKHFKLTKIKK